LTGEEASYNYGWATQPKSETKPHCNHWLGYACNHGRVYVEDDSYFLIFPQFMASSEAGIVYGKTIRAKGTEAFESLWN